MRQKKEHAAAFLLDFLSKLPKEQLCMLDACPSNGRSFQQAVQNLVQAGAQGMNRLCEEDATFLVRVVRKSELQEIRVAITKLADAHTPTPSTPPPAVSNQPPTNAPNPSLDRLKDTPRRRNVGSVHNSSEYRKNMDKLLGMELAIDSDVPGFLEKILNQQSLEVHERAEALIAAFERDASALYENQRWKTWPDVAKETAVVNWLKDITEAVLSRLTNHSEHHHALKRILVGSGDKPVSGSTSKRKLDVGLADASLDSEEVGWNKILIVGELKSNESEDSNRSTCEDLARYAREVFSAQEDRCFVLGFTLCKTIMRIWQFDRLGAVGGEGFDIHKRPLEFLVAWTGFLSMNEQQPGFDPTIIKDRIDNTRYIKIQRSGTEEIIFLDKLIHRVPALTGRATTCWKAHPENDPDTILVVKDSWQFVERDHEGELLERAREYNVQGVAAHYHHEVVRVNDIHHDIVNSVRGSLVINPKMGNQNFLAMPGHDTSKVVQRTSSASGKRPSTSIYMQMPPGKRICTGDPANREHHRLIVKSFGQPLHFAQDPIQLLTALADCIAGYKSLHLKAGLLQSDISPSNLLIDSDGKGFMIDLDLAVEVDRKETSGAPAKTGTRAFMAVGLLLGEFHTCIHDLESFFWVFIWICVHYTSPEKAVVVPAFEQWNYIDDAPLALIKKGIISDRSDFSTQIKKDFQVSYNSLHGCATHWRDIMFPGGNRLKTEETNAEVLHKKLLEMLREEVEKLKGEPTG